MYADDVIIYTSATSKDELEYRLQVCIDNISNWYSINKLCINKKKSNVMVIGSKWQLKSLNLDNFTISVDSDKLLLAKQAKYLGLWVRNHLSWDDHILELCRKMYYYFHMFRRLRKILPSALLLNIYKTYVQSKIDHRLSIWGCTTEVNLNRVQRIQNLLARIIWLYSLAWYWFSSIIETPDHTRKTRLLSVCFNVQMYSWPRAPLSE